MGPRGADLVGLRTLNKARVSKWKSRVKDWMVVYSLEGWIWLLGYKDSLGAGGVSVEKQRAWDARVIKREKDNSLDQDGGMRQS